MDSIEGDLVWALERIAAVIDRDAMTDDTNVDHIRRIHSVRKIAENALEKAAHHAALRSMGAFNDE